MPIYEYRCHGCGEEFEVMQKISARPLRKCRGCGGRLEKLLSQTSFVLRGGGWYSDGYSGKAGAKKRPAPGGETAAKDAPAKEGPAKGGGKGSKGSRGGTSSASKAGGSE